MGRDTFVFHKAWGKNIKRLTPEQHSKLLLALIDYEPGAEYDTGDFHTNTALDYITGDIDRDAAKYEETCAKRQQAARSRWENANASKSIQMHEEHTNDYDSEYVSDSDIDMFCNDSEYEPPTAATPSHLQKPEGTQTESDPERKAILYFASKGRSKKDALRFYQEKSGYRTFPEKWQQWADEWMQRNPERKLKNDVSEHHDYDIKGLSKAAKE